MFVLIATVARCDNGGDPHNHEDRLIASKRVFDSAVNARSRAQECFEYLDDALPEGDAVLSVDVYRLVKEQG